MPGKVMQLRDFGEAELIFDDNETRAILKFFFQTDGVQIERTDMTRDLRNLAQGLLVEAVDATYAMGWIELTFRWVLNPGSGMKKALQRLAQRASRYWFRNLKNQSLADAKIYERIRDQLANSFRSPFLIMVLAKAGTGFRPLGFVDYGARVTSSVRVWG